MRKIVFFMAAFLMALLLSGPTTGVQASTSVPAEAALVADAQTGQVLYQQNARAVLPIASISKLLTVMVIQDEVNQYHLTWDSPVKISPAVARIANDPTYSNVPLKAGDTWTVGDLTQAALVKSADGATLALAEATGKSPAGFVTLLKEKARSLGVTDAVLVNGVGLQNGQVKDFGLPGVPAEVENQMSAVDVAKVASALVTKEPRLLKIAGQREMNAHGVKEQTINKLLTDKQYHVPGVTIDGLKTGTSDAAGACLVSTGSYRGRRLVTVVLHAAGDDPDARFGATRDLYKQIVAGGWRPARQALPKEVIDQPVAGWGHHMVQAQPTHLTIWRRPDQNRRPTTIALTPSQPVDQQGRFRRPVHRSCQLAHLWVRVPEVGTLDPAGLSFNLQAN